MILEKKLKVESNFVMQDSDIMIDQIKAIDNARLVNKIGDLPGNLIDLVIENIEIILEYFGFLKKTKKLIKISIIALSIIGSGFLIYTGHLGATLVYQQAAGVYTPSEDCNEFID